jgi:hypothetical protein
MIHHHFSAGVYAKETRIPAGHKLVDDTIPNNILLLE